MNQSIYTEYANLTPDHIEWLDGCGAVWCDGAETFSQFIPEMAYVLFEDGEFSQEDDVDSRIDRIHIPTGSEFCERVAEILGIEKPVFASGYIEAFEPNEEEINKGIDKAEKEWQAKDKVGEDLEKFGIPIQPTHPHRLYRVLDSLDGIPFDTRIALSEWIPPMGVDVNFIHNGDFDRGQIQCIDKHGIIVKWRGLACVFESDGHWMRIV